MAEFREDEADAGFAPFRAFRDRLLTADAQEVLDAILETILLSPARAAALESRRAERLVCLAPVVDAASCLLVDGTRLPTLVERLAFPAVTRFADDGA